MSAIIQIVELELSKQCGITNLFKTPHSIDKVSTYIPNIFIESDVNTFNLTQECVKYFTRLNKDMEENLSKNT
jgi:hypothetical protein